MTILKCLRSLYLSAKKQLKLWNKHGRPIDDSSTKFYKDQDIMIYTITKAITTFETYSVASDSPENAVKLLELDPNTYYVDSETIEPEYAIVNVER